MVPLDLELADLLIKLGDDRLVALLPLPIAPLKDPGRSLQEGLVPRLDLARMHLEPTGQLDRGLVPLQGCQGHLSLE